MASANTLYDKAMANLRTARLVLEHAEGDEEQANLAGLHLQQSLELALKYQLEQYGVEHPRTHDVDQLIRMAQEAKVDLHLPDYLEDHAEMLSVWEVKARYVLGYAIDPQKVERALSELEAYLDDLAARETEEIEAEEANSADR